MKREEIENLLAEYVNGEISAAEKHKLEELFRQDPYLKQEAEEMSRIWNSMENIEAKSVTSARMDARFYQMLNSSEIRNHGILNLVTIKRNWLKLAIASAACIAAFVIGKTTAEPEQVTMYKTVYMKAPIGTEKSGLGSANNLPVQAIKPPNRPLKSNADVNAQLIQKLRSVYASERITAITELCKPENLNTTTLKMLALTLREDPNPNVRLALINALQPMSTREKVQAVLISALNHQEDELIQTSIIDLLVEARSKIALPELVGLLENKNTNIMVQHKIQSGIETFLY